MIPNEAIDQWYGKSLKQLESEEEYPNLFFNSDASIMDNFMDTLFIRTCHVSETYENPLQAAMDNNGYPRYWNGYLLTLRPMLTMFSYQQIRYINLFIFFFLLCFVFYGICSRIGKAEGAAFLLSQVMLIPVLIPQSLQYFSVFVIMLGAMLALLSKKRWSFSEAVPLFLTVGMLTNFFDMLTAPLLTLGMPLVIYLLLADRNGNKFGFWEGLRQVVLLSAAWGAGYGFCWAAKWVIGTAVLHVDVVADAAATAQFRTSGSEAYPLDRKAMFLSNLNAFFFAKGRRPAALILGIPALLFVIGLIIGRRERKQNDLILLLVIISLFPYIWYFVLANHSQLHYFYTYRIQAVSIFALLCALIRFVDPEKIKKKIGY